VPRGIWIHVTGDSVAAQLFPHYVKAISAKRVTVKWFKAQGRKGKDLAVGCTAQCTCMTFSTWWDYGYRTSQADFETLSYLPPDSHEALRSRGCGTSQWAPNVTVFSLGSHHKEVWGYDDDARTRFEFVFDVFLSSAVQNMTTKFVLVAEGATDVQVTPTRFAHPDGQCLLSNWRKQHRNQLMAAVFNRLCDARKEQGLQCRFLDLFSPTVTLTGAAPGLFYLERDPVHALRPRMDKLAFAGTMLLDALGSFSF